MGDFDPSSTNFVDRVRNSGMACVIYGTWMHWTLELRKITAWEEGKQRGSLWRGHEACSMKAQWRLTEKRFKWISSVKGAGSFTGDIAIRTSCFQEGGAFKWRKVWGLEQDSRHIISLLCLPLISISRNCSSYCHPPARPRCLCQ